MVPARASRSRLESLSMSRRRRAMAMSRGPRVADFLSSPRSSSAETRRILAVQAQGAALVV